ncbi:SCO0607 family lipoprotein [Phytohabitans suffuscus]|uniref:Lipoprotein n=1 Tax=Phytohabitans suffuscus TaxID=624315 RepID=A0A6F8YIJ7_9ACTN|nr:hypothetical protein [Phytohabitans suffuscus]BCB85839.1 hypothetical protein Psuf_031520 [Phytohabitans suffuscus]
MYTTIGRLLLATAAVASLAAAAGCEYREQVCSTGEYPVKAVGGTTGGACVKDGEEPPAGYVRYPAGKVPEYVDDEWDQYWNGKVVDERGNIVQEGQ